MEISQLCPHRPSNYFFLFFGTKNLESFGERESEVCRMSEFAIYLLLRGNSALLGMGVSTIPQKKMNQAAFPSANFQPIIIDFVLSRKKKSSREANNFPNYSAEEVSRAVLFLPFSLIRGKRGRGRIFRGGGGRGRGAERVFLPHISTGPSPPLNGKINEGRGTLTHISHIPWSMDVAPLSTN